MFPGQRGHHPYAYSQSQDNISMVESREFSVSLLGPALCLFGDGPLPLCEDSGRACHHWEVLFMLLSTSSAGIRWQIPVRPRRPILDGLAAFDRQFHSETIATWVASALTAEFGAVPASRPCPVTIRLLIQPERNPSYLTGIGCPHGAGDRRSLALMQGPQAREAVGGCVTLSGTSLKRVLFQMQSLSYFVIWDFVVGQREMGHLGRRVFCW